jgi:hypothetical protein
MSSMGNGGASFSGLMQQKWPLESVAEQQD